MYALITGASGGIGQAIAKQLAAEGYTLYLHYYQGKEKISRLLEEIGNHHIAIEANLATKEGACVLWNQIQHPPEAVIYTAGKSVVGLATDFTGEQIEEMITLHLTNMYKVMNDALPAMIQNKRGNIVIISSIWGEVGASCEVLYSMVKGGQNTYTKALAKEVAPSGVRVNAVAPGAVATDMMTMFSEEEQSQVAEEIPMGRFAKAEEIAAVVSFLLSKQASYITGQVLGVNGGWN